MKLRLLGRLLGLLFNPRVPRYKKQLFVIIIIAYWLAPDLMPFIPLDDLLVTLLGSWLFVQSAEKDVSGGRSGKNARPIKEKDYIDVESYRVDEDEN